MKKKLLILSAVAVMMIGQSISVFASDNTVLSECNIDIKKIKADAVNTVISNPTTIVNYNGKEYVKGNKNSIEEENNIKYENVDATVINTIIVSPKTIVDINVPQANELKPACLNKFDN